MEEERISPQTHRNNFMGSNDTNETFESSMQLREKRPSKKALKEKKIVEVSTESVRVEDESQTIGMDANLDS